MILAKFQCMSCKYEFSMSPGPKVKCLQCLNKYVMWINYKQWQVAYANKRSK